MADDQLNRNAIRMLREAWSTPAALAQELFMTFADESASPPAQPQHVTDRMERMASNVPTPSQRPGSVQLPSARAGTGSLPPSVVPRPSLSLGDKVRRAQAAAQQVPFQLPGMPSLPSPAVPAVPTGIMAQSNASHAWTGSDELEWRQQHSYEVPGRQPSQPPSQIAGPRIPAANYPSVISGLTPAAMPTQQAALPTYTLTPDFVATQDIPSGAYTVFPGTVSRGVLATPEQQEEPPKLKLYEPPAEHASPRPTEHDSARFRTVQFGVSQAPTFDAVLGIPFTSGKPLRRFPEREDLPVPAHVKFDMNPTSTYGYAPLGTPGAYSGNEREAGDSMTHENPRYERDPSDPFAKKYYDLRFFPTDFDSPRPSGGGGGSGDIVAKIVAFTPQTLLPGTGTVGQQTVQINTYTDGLADGPDQGGPFNAIIPQILSTESIPDGTVMMVTKASDGNYYGQLPIWLE